MEWEKDDTKDIENYVLFHKGWPSNWTKSPFKINDNFEYNCCEQRMMYMKALISGDYEKTDQIKKAKNPEEQKNLGSKVKPYEEETWKALREIIVYEANYAKYTQNKDLKKKLKEKKYKTFIEAAENDKIWGICKKTDNFNKDDFINKIEPNYYLEDPVEPKQCNDDNTPLNLLGFTINRVINTLEILEELKDDKST
jgi:ribA/ribD-fused uncharacterized protein